MRQSNIKTRDDNVGYHRYHRLGRRLVLLLLLAGSSGQLAYGVQYLYDFDVLVTVPVKTSVNTCNIGFSGDGITNPGSTAVLDFGELDVANFDNKVGITKNFNITMSCTDYAPQAITLQFTTTNQKATGTAHTDWFYPTRNGEKQNNLYYGLRWPLDKLSRYFATSIAEVDKALDQSTGSVGKNFPNFDSFASPPTPNTKPLPDVPWVSVNGTVYGPFLLSNMAIPPGSKTLTIPMTIFEGIAVNNNANDAKAKATIMKYGVYEAAVSVTISYQ